MNPLSRKFSACLLGGSLALILGAALHAGETRVVDVKAAQSADGTWRFDVALAHNDEGWEHYADEWRIIGPDGTLYGTRTLLHPHVHEQPFIRALSGVIIPEEICEVQIIGKDNIHGDGTPSASVKLCE